MTRTPIASSTATTRSDCSPRCRSSSRSRSRRARRGGRSTTSTRSNAISCSGRSRSRRAPRSPSCFVSSPIRSASPRFPSRRSAPRPRANAMTWPAASWPRSAGCCLRRAPPRSSRAASSAAARAAANALRFAGADADASLVESGARRGARGAGARRHAARARSPAGRRRRPVPADPSQGGVGSDAPPSLAIRTLRIEEAKVDRLIDLAGELIVAKNSLNDLASRAEAELGEQRDRARIRTQAAAIDRLVGQAHHAAVELRMVPLAQMFRRFTRVVRDGAQELGKSVELVLSGEDTEADKAIVDAMFEPLLHVVRNALDHGIETPQERRAAGKPEQAQIAMRALHQGEQVVIEIRDDGRGNRSGGGAAQGARAVADQRRGGARAGGRADHPAGVLGRPVDQRAGVADVRARGRARRGARRGRAVRRLRQGREPPRARARPSGSRCR